MSFLSWFGKYFVDGGTEFVEGDPGGGDDLRCNIVLQTSPVWQVQCSSLSYFLRRTTQDDHLRTSGETRKKYSFYYLKIKIKSQNFYQVFDTSVQGLSRLSPNSLSLYSHSQMFTDETFFSSDLSRSLVPCSYMNRESVRPATGETFWVSLLCTLGTMVPETRLVLSSLTNIHLN